MKLCRQQTILMCIRLGKYFYHQQKYLFLTIAMRDHSHEINNILDKEVLALNNIIMYKTLFCPNEFIVLQWIVFTVSALFILDPNSGLIRDWSLILEG